ncbi:MAG: glucose-1-phosphate adenylyltransferase [Candidatus Eisenbacteria bacterium]|nr:glucose-1-phosphate adenylyltransferase [Candidatus Eisenbacteria bacterium]
MRQDPEGSVAHCRNGRSAIGVRLPGRGGGDVTRETVVMVLAGGKGERLWPLTRDRAKPAVPFGGIYRIIDFSLSNAINSGLRQVFVLTQYKSISLTRHMRRGWGHLSNVMGEFVEAVPAQQRVGEVWYRGTADAIWQNAYLLDQLKPKPRFVLVLSGDHVYQMDYTGLLAYHAASGAQVTVCTQERDVAEAGALGVLQVDESMRVRGFQEKPDSPLTLPGRPDRVLASMGIYVFNTDFMVRRLAEAAERELFDFGLGVLPDMVGREDNVRAFVFGDESSPGYWRDVGTIDAYWEANMDLVSTTPALNLYDPEWPVHTYQGRYPPAKFLHDGSIEGGRLGVAVDSIVSTGCIISGGRIQRCVLSPRVRTNSYSYAFESILMEDVDVGRYAKLRRVIVDKGVRIPPKTQIGYDPEEDAGRFTITDSGIVVVPKGYTF